MTLLAKLGRPYMMAPVTVEDFTIAGVGAARDVVLGNHLLNFAGSLLLGRGLHSSTSQLNLSRFGNKNSHCTRLFRLTPPKQSLNNP